MGNKVPFLQFLENFLANSNAELFRNLSFRTVRIPLLKAASQQLLDNFIHFHY